MNSMLLPVLATLLPLGLFAVQTVPSKDDKDRLQGTWTVVSAKRDGKTDDNAQKDKLKISGDKMIVQSESHTEETTFKLDSSRKPRAIDVSTKNGKDMPVLGIYLLEDDTLKLCFSRPGEDRPAEFDSKPGSRVMLVVLKREKP